MTKANGILSEGEEQYLKGKSKVYKCGKRIEDKAKNIPKIIPSFLKDVTLLVTSHHIDSEVKRMVQEELLKIHVKETMKKPTRGQILSSFIQSESLKGWHNGKMIRGLLEVVKPTTEQGKIDFLLALHDSLFPRENKYLTKDLKRRKKEILDIHSKKGVELGLSLTKLVKLNNLVINTIQNECGREIDFLLELKFSQSRSSLDSVISGDWIKLSSISMIILHMAVDRKTSDIESAVDRIVLKEKAREYIHENNFPQKLEMFKTLEKHQEYLRNKNWRGLKGIDFFIMAFCKESKDTALRNTLAIKLTTGKGIVTKVGKDISKLKPKILEIKANGKRYELSDYGKCLRDSFLGISHVSRLINWSYLFSLDLDYRQYLRKGAIAHELRNVFKDHKHQLSSSAKLSKKDEKWVVTEDDRDNYTVMDTGKELNIYNYPPIPDYWDTTLNKEFLKA